MMDTGAHRSGKGRAWMLGVVLSLVALLSLGIYEINLHWPYRYRNVKPLIENVFASQITVTKYHRTYFPRPGFVAEGITLRRNSKTGVLPPLGTAESIQVAGGWGDLLMLRRHVQLVEVHGMHVSLPPAGSELLRQNFPPGSSADFAGPSTTIGKLLAVDSVFEMQREKNSPLRFPIRQLELRGLGRGLAIKYSVDMWNALPSGHIVAHGKFGPTITDDLSRTQVSGEFTFDDVQMDQMAQLRGVLSSTGRFSGTLGALDVQVSTDTPHFALGDGQPTPLKAEAHLAIDALKGDVQMHSVDAVIARTKVHASGSVAGSPNKTIVDVEVRVGRVEELMRPFQHDRPPVTGAVTVRAHASVRPGKPNEAFLDKLDAQATFEVANERLTDAQQQTELSELSARMQKDDAARDAPVTPQALSSLGGTIVLQHGVVHTGGLTFAVPGLSTMLHGTYDMRSKNVHMTGDVRMERDLSHVTTGCKSWMLKPIAPFFRRRHADAVVPIAITGTAGHYSVGQNILGKK